MRTYAIGFASALLVTASSAFAADMPTRKPGLWEITIENPAMAGAGMESMTSKQCIDATTDARMQQMGADGDCKVGDLKRSGNSFSLDSVCKIGGTTATTRMLGQGDFNSAYTMDVKSTYAPPLHGMSEGSVKLRAKYAGSCGADMKPGDMLMPNGMKVNVNQMGAMGRPPR